jgi:hypothetical protein
MYFEREDKPKLSIVLLSILFLTLCISFFYYFRGDTGNHDTYKRLANLKSLVEVGQLRTYSEPLPLTIISIFKKITFSNYMVGYQIALAFTFSVFLHMIMLNFYKKEWRPNHYFLVYLTAFMPFSINLPFYYHEEIVCLIFLLILNYSFKLEEISDLFFLVLYTILAFLSHIEIFLTGYLIFIAMASLKKMRENKSKTTVFFKKKNIALRIFLTAIGTFMVIALLISLFDFFGKSSFLHLTEETLEIFYRLIPIILALFIGQYLLRSEKELNNAGTTAVVVLVILVSIYFSYNANKENLDYLKNLEGEIVSLKKSGRLNSNRIFGSPLVSNYIFYHSGENIQILSKNDFQKNDYFILENFSETDKSFLDRKNIPSFQYFILDNSTVLISWELIDRFLKESEKSNLQQVLQGIFQTIDEKNTPHQRLNRFLNSIFGN